MKWMCLRFVVSTLLMSVPINVLAKDGFVISCEELAIMQAGAKGQEKSLNEVLQDCAWQQRLNTAAENPSADPYAIQEFQGYQQNQQLKGIQTELKKIRDCQKFGHC